MLQLLEDGATIKTLTYPTRTTTHRSGKRSRCFQLFSLLSLADVASAWVSPTGGGRPASFSTSASIMTTSTTQLEALSVGGNHQNSLGKRRGSKANTSNNSGNPWWSPMPSANSNSRPRNQSPAAKSNARISKSSTTTPSSPIQLPSFWITQASQQLRHTARKEGSNKQLKTRHPKTAPPSDMEIALELQRHWEQQQLRTLLDLLVTTTTTAPPPSRTTTRVTGLTLLVLLTHVGVDQWCSNHETAVAFHWAATNAYFVSLLARPVRDGWGGAGRKNDE